MIPVSSHGEFPPTIKFLFRVRPKLLCSYLRNCYRVIKRFRRTISVYVCLISLDDDCSLVAAGVRIATKYNGNRSSRHHQGVSPPSEVNKRSFSPRLWIEERGIISICVSIWLGANSIKLSRCGGELAMGRNRQLPSQKKNNFKADTSSISLANNRLMDVNQLALTWVGWPNGEKLASTCVQILTKVSASHRKSTQVNASARKAWSNGVASRRKLRTKLASTCESVWQGLKLELIFWKKIVNIFVFSLQPFHGKM